MTREKEVAVPNGWLMLVVTIVIFAIGIALEIWFGFTAAEAAKAGGLPNFWLLGGGILVIGFGIFMCFGFFTLQPNEGRALILFGSYRGTARTSGWHWTNPLNTQDAAVAAVAKLQQREAEGE